MRITVSADTDVLEALRDAHVQAPRTVARRVVRDILPAYERRIVRILERAPGSPKYPIQWTSEAQRKAVMAKLREDDNIPYQRTGELERGWNIDASWGGFGGEITIENDAEHAEFVVGERQQRFHRNTGWEYAPDVADDEQKRLTDDIIDVYLEVVDTPSGRRRR